MSEREADIDGFLAGAGWGASRRVKLAGDASFRHYQRVTRGGKTAVLMDAPPQRETVAPYLRIARLLARLDLSAPKILAADEALGLVLLEDLGDDTYTRMFAKGGDEGELYRCAVDALVTLHGRSKPEDGAGIATFDQARMLDQVALLVEWYRPAVLGLTTPPDLAAAWRDAWRQVLTAMPDCGRTLVLFDYHVDNLMWLPGRQGAARCGLLDFQDAVIGPPPFDLMSLLQDVRREVPAAIVTAMRAHYDAAFAGATGAAFETVYRVMGAQRNCRILGTFARLNYRDGKPGYLAYIPRVWRLIEENLACPALAPVAAWLDRHMNERVIPSRPGLP